MTQPPTPWQDRIEIDPARLGGKPVVRGSRIAVELVVGMVADGWSEAHIVEEYPTLTAEDVRACLHCAAECRRQSRLLCDDPHEREVLDWPGVAADTDGWR